ncbi:PspC domain-containing protein [Paenibacillus sabuli]|nr:PspC domain-containing protein [Paenibacillus sabuli]
MHKLYRSRSDRKLTGICGGLAKYVGVDATLLRFLAIVGTIFTSGGLLLVYIIAAFVIPNEPGYDAHGMYEYGPRTEGYSAYGGAAGATQWQSAAGGGYGSGHMSSPGSYKAEPAGVDAAMDDLEKKALRKELDQYRAKLAQYENEER